MLFLCITFFTLLCQNVFVAAKSPSSSPNSDYENEEECGQLSVTLDTSLSGGEPALHEEMPWQAGVYSKRKQPYMQVCGGSLVSRKVVISAAHCFWSETEQQLPAKDFAVALGKLYRPWNDPKDVDAQKSDVREIHIPPRFHGSITNFQDDLALLLLTTAIRYNSYVMPVCLNFEYTLDEKHTSEGNLGKVAGWGRTDKNGKPSLTLQVLHLPVVDVARCFDTIEPSFRPAITSDKICAGRTMEGTAVCMGDSGGGLSFPENTTDGERYYLRGVVSTAPRSVYDNLCNIYTYATFTHLAKHEHFIRVVMKRASETTIEEPAEVFIDPDAPPIPHIESLPDSSNPSTFRPLNEIVGGRRKPLKKKKFATKEKDIKSEDQTTEEPKTNLNQTKVKDTDAEAEYTVQVIEDPTKTVDETSQQDIDTETQTKSDTDEAKFSIQIIEDSVETEPKPVRPLADTDDDEDILNKAPNIIQTAPSQVDSDSKPESILQVDESKTQTKPADETVTVKGTPTKPKPSDPDAEAEYKVQIVEEPVTETRPTKADKTTEKQPVLLSISSEPFLSTNTQSEGTDISSDNEQVSSQKEVEDKSSIGNQPDVFTTSQSKDNEPEISTGNQPTQSIGNKPSQSENEQSSGNQQEDEVNESSIENQQNVFTISQSKDNQPEVSTGNQPSQSIGNEPFQPIGNQPSQSENEQVSSGNQQEDEVDESSIENQPDVNQPEISIGNEPFQSIGNQPSQSINNQATQSWNKQPVSSNPQTTNQPLSENQPAETITQLPLTTKTSTQSTNKENIETVQPVVNQPLPSWLQSIGNQATQTVKQPATVPNKPLFPSWNQGSQWNQQSTNKPSFQTIQSVEQVIPGITPPVSFEQSVPSLQTTQKNPDLTYVQHKWNNRFGYHQHHPYDCHHDHYGYHYNHGEDHGYDHGEDHCYNHGYHYHPHDYHHDYHNPQHHHHDWHKFHNRW